jgi:hypothetical protein
VALARVIRRGLKPGWPASQAGWLALIAALVTLSALAPAGAGARAWVPPGGHVYAGLTGGTTIVRFEHMVRKHPPVFELYITWNTPTGWLSPPDRAFRSRLALHISTAPGYGQPGVISPQGIALGHSDRFLMNLGRHLAHSGRVVYIRLMGEPNGHWNAYAAFNADGSSRGPQNSPAWYVQAWRRSVLILRGGRVRAIDRRLRALGLPPVQGRLERNRRGRLLPLPRPRVTFLWVPQDAGSPDIPANAPAAFFPGYAYVDWVGTDFYASYPNFSLLNSFYSQFNQRPFVLSEWALYGADDPGFVHALFGWVHSHRRLRMLNYYQGFVASSPANLAHYPASQAALRQELSSPLFLAYAPEYKHPYRPRPKPGKHPRPTPSQPPQPPQPGPAPGPAPICVGLLNVCTPGL